MLSKVERVCRLLDADGLEYERDNSLISLYFEAPLQLDEVLCNALVVFNCSPLILPESSGVQVVALSDERVEKGAEALLRSYLDVNFLMYPATHLALDARTAQVAVSHLCLLSEEDEESWLAHQLFYTISFLANVGLAMLRDYRRRRRVGAARHYMNRFLKSRDRLQEIVERLEEQARFSLEKMFRM